MGSYKKKTTVYYLIIVDFFSAKPVSILTEINSYYAPNETAEFRCEVLSHPEPNTTWSFLRCPNYPSLKDSTIVQLTVYIISAISY